MNAPPFPLNPQVGTRYGNYVWNGATWVCAPTTGIQVTVQVFTASGPYMPSPGLVSAQVECIGGGGGGGGVGPILGTQVMGGAGGGSGGRSVKFLPAALVMGGVSVTIGAGGAEGADNGGPGGNGSATSFGALCVANGGTGGGGVNGTTTLGGAGDGAAPGVGDLAFPGSGGGPGTYIASGASAAAYQGGMGGQIVGGNIVNHAFPGGGATGFDAANGTGAGGSGGIVNQEAGAHGPGGAGGSGICWVTEYCWATAAGEDCNPPINVNARVALTHVPWPGPGPCPPGYGDYGEEG